MFGSAMSEEQLKVLSSAPLSLIEQFQKEAQEKASKYQSQAAMLNRYIKKRKKQEKMDEFRSDLIAKFKPQTECENAS